MTPQEFLAAVLPSTGIYCCAELSKAITHKFVNTISELAQTSLDFCKRPKPSVYFALASYKTADNRTAANAMLMRSLFMDLDCVGGGEKCYTSKKEAADALSAFLQVTEMESLGTPWIVSSGGGLHVYWPLQEDVPIAVWKPVAENLKRLAKTHALKMDFTVTADAARVLRVPETFNHKRGKPVKILHVGDTFDFAVFSERVKDKLNGRAVEFDPAPKAKLLLPGTAPVMPSGAVIKMFENTGTSFKKLVKGAASGEGCGQLAYYMEHAKNDGMEPLWRALLSISAKCDDAEKAAVQLSAMHPYATRLMHKKLQEIKGPYPCTKFDSENPGVCTNCQYWGKITNPLALGRVTLTDNTAKQVTLTLPATNNPIQITKPVPPWGFSYGKNGGVYKDIKDTDEEGNPVTIQSMVLSYDLYAVDMLQSGENHMLRMMAVRPEGPVDILIPAKSLPSKDETTKALANQNILSVAGADTILYQYIRGCAGDVSVNRRAIKVPDSYGWQDDGTFVFNSSIYSAKGVVPMPMPDMVNLNQNTKPTGDLNEWRAVVNLLIKKKLYTHLAMALIGFGAPLMKYLTGLNGLAFHVGSTESGHGKSLLLELCCSIWGDPQRFKVPHQTSDNAMIQRLGMLNSLPLCSDEITEKSQTHPDWFGAFLLDFTQAKGKERMEGGANKERKNTSFWSTLALFCSHKHMLDHLTSRKNARQGDLYRLLEVTPPNKVTLSTEEQVVWRKVYTNFGVAGEAYVKWLVRNSALAEKMTLDMNAALLTRFEMNSEERYWQAGISCMLASGIIISSAHAGIVDMPMQEIEKALRDLVLSARGTIKLNVRLGIDVLNGYIRENYNKLIMVRLVGKEYEIVHGANRAVDESITKSQVEGRVETGVIPGYRVFYIEEQRMKNYCSTVGFGYSDFRRQIEKLFPCSYIKKDLLGQTKGPCLRVNTIKIVMPESAPLEAESEPADN